MEEQKYKYIAETDEVEQEIVSTVKVNIPFVQIKNELENLLIEIEPKKARIEELRAILKLKK